MSDHGSQSTHSDNVSDEKTHNAINSKMFKRLNHITDQLHEVELVNSEIEHRELIIVGFFILQYAKLTMVEPYYNIFKSFCDTDKYEELETETDSLYLALSEDNSEDVIFPKKGAEWTCYFLKIALKTLLRMQSKIFSSELAVLSTRDMKRESRASSKKRLDVQKCCVSVAKHNVFTISTLTSTGVAAKDSIKEHWKTVAMEQCQGIAKCWRNQLIELQPIEDFERFSIVLLRMNKQREDCPTFFKKNSRRKWNTHKTLILVSFNGSFNCLSTFIHSNELFQTITQTFYLA